jgi:hypothetical protein
MDLVTIVGGLFIAITSGMDAAGAERAVDVLAELADRESCTPAERHIFKCLVDSMSRRPSQAYPSLRVIEGGAA